MSFADEVTKLEKNFKEQAEKALALAKKGGALECEVVIEGTLGLDVSTRHGEVENIEFNKSSGMEVIVYKDGRRGSASTTDFSAAALNDTVEAALSIASYADKDPCAGIADQDLLCTEEKDLKLLYDIFEDPAPALKRASDLEKLALSYTGTDIKDTDGADCESILNVRVLGNSHGFLKSTAGTCYYNSMTLIGEKDGRMQRGYGYTISRDEKGLWPVETVCEEALERTRAKLGAVKCATKRCNVIFSKQAALSLWGHLLSAVSGSAVYRKATFLADKLGEKILPSFVTLHEDPFVIKGLGSFNFDLEGVRVRENDIIKDGILDMYLLSTYTGRKLGQRSNGHAGGVGNLFVNAKESYVRDFEDLLKEAGEGLVITDLMGQGVDLVSGNYSRGALGYYFKNGTKVHPVEEITVAGNLREMFLNIALLGNDRDPRTRIQSGSILIPDLTVSGTEQSSQGS